jgi:Domain of Unknown Function (DUF748)
VNGLLGFLVGCGHQASPPASEPTAAQAGPDPAPGARPGERNHLLEAKWKEVVVKAQKEGQDIAASIKLIAPEIRIFHAAPPPENDGGNAAKATEKDAQKPPAEIIDLNEEFRKVTALDVDHLDILDGQVAFIDTSRAERPELWLHDLQLSAENLATRQHLAGGRPVLLTASGTLAQSGKVSIFISAEPFEKGLTFSGRAAIVGLQTSELYRFIEPATKLQAPEGTIDIFVEFDCRNGALNGGVKPVLKNVKVRPTKKNPFAVIEAWAVDLAVRIFSDRVQQRNAVATVIPIKGTLTGVNVELWPAIFGVLRNAFVEGLTSGYAHLPPPDAAVSGAPAGSGQASDPSTPPKPPSAEPTP